ncbi:hypothetical protein CYANOKiyG1_77750 [Okeania sp. KiyG1]|nr:hypothetical protein CYANOKiyG1_77750 [Okeania sp. KiyG1]
MSRTEKDGKIITLADEYNGKRLNSPNDLVVKSDGSIYFTEKLWFKASPFKGIINKNFHY